MYMFFIISFSQFVFLFVLIVAVASAAQTNSNQKAVITRSYYETPTITEDVIDEKILEVSLYNTKQLQL